MSDEKLAQAITLVKKLRDELQAAVLKEHGNPVGGEFLLNGSYGIKWLDRALDIMRELKGPEIKLEAFDILNDEKFKKITYCEALGILEAQMKDGTVRMHKGVDRSLWYRVTHEGDLLLGYYSYVWDKTPCDIQMPDSPTLEKLASK